MRPATAKAKGRSTEQALCEWLQARGVPAERRRLAGTADRGDIAGWRSVTVEVKSGAALDLPGWLRELAAEQANTGDPHGVLVIRPKGRTNPDDWWAVLPWPVAFALIEEARRAHQP